LEQLEGKQVTNMRDKKSKKNVQEYSVGRELWEYIKLIVIVVVVMVGLQRFVIINAQIPSESMENNIMTGDRIFGNRLAYIKSNPKRFDVVIFKFPDNENEYFIKRVIGLPGETVDIVDGKVYIDGSDTPLDDSFCKEEHLGVKDGHFEVPEESYFMLGDNRNVSRDSRFWNNPYVKKEKILGKAVVRYWPLTKISLIK